MRRQLSDECDGQIIGGEDGHSVDEDGKRAFFSQGKEMTALGLDVAAGVVDGRDNQGRVGAVLRRPNQIAQGLAGAFGSASGQDEMVGGNGLAGGLEHGPTFIRFQIHELAGAAEDEKSVYASMQPADDIGLHGLGRGFIFDEWRDASGDNAVEFHGGDSF